MLMTPLPKRVEQYANLPFASSRSPNVMEDFVQAGELLASVSAVLGGLAFTAAASLLAAGTGTNDPDALNRPAKITIASAVLSTLLLITAAVIFSTLAAGAALADTNDPRAIDGYLSLLQYAYFGLFAGAFSFFVSVGTSGWIASRILGAITTTGAVVAGAVTLRVLDWFGQF
jgi:hypothetical protein